MSAYKNESRCEMQGPSKTDDEGEVFREVPTASNGLLRRRFVAGGSHEQNRSKGPESRGVELKGEGEEDNAENVGSLRASQIGEVRVSSRNRNSSDVEYLDDDGGSSVCSENIYSSGDFMSLPCDNSSKWSTWERKIRRRERESLLESLEKQRRESVGNRLKELRMPNKRHSISLLPTCDMPIIAKAKPLKDATLPKQMRRASYQSVIVTPFFSKSGVSVAKPLLQGVGQEMRELRDSLTSPRVKTPTGTPWETRSFPLRATESLSGIENFGGPPENVFSAKLFKCPSSGTKTRKSVDAVESKQPLNSSLSTIQQTQSSDQWPEESLENGCSSNYPAQSLKEVHQIRQDSFSNRNEQIHDSNRPDVAEKSGVTSETERECFAKPDVLPRGVPSSKLDSPKVSREVYSLAEVPLSETDYRPLSVKIMDSSESDEQFRGVLSTEKSPDCLLNGTYSVKTEYSSDKSSETSSIEINDKNEMKSSVSLNLETPSSVETCREDKTNFISPILSLQTSSTPQETNSPSSHPERDSKSDANGGFDLDNTRPRNVDYKDAVNQLKAPVYPTASRKYCSDLQIQLKEVEPVFPTNFGQSYKNSDCSGGNGDDLPKERAPTPIDEHDDVEEVAPNWSSYPGTLPDDFRSEELNDFTTTSKTTREAKITTTAPERSVSTLEINLQSPSIGEREKVSKKEAPQTDTYDFSHEPNKSKVSSVLSLWTDANVDSRPESNFNDQRKCVIMENVTAEVDPLGTSRKSVERNEIFLVQDSSSTTARTMTLPRDQRSRSWNQFDGPIGGRHLSSDTQTRGLGAPQQELNTTPKQQLSDGFESVTPDGLSVEVTPSKANVTRITFYSKKDEQRTRFRDGERTRSSFEAVGGISKSGDSWQASIVKRENRWKDSGMSRDSSRSPEKTPSVERIWETLEQQPQSRLTKQNIRLGSDSEVIGQRTEKPPQYLQRHRVASDSGTGEAKVDAVVRSISMIDAPPVPVAEGSEGESLLEIEVQKGGLGLGFCIEGGKDGPYGDRPITVKRLFRGSSDSKFAGGAKDNLRAGDEILSANGRDMSLLSRFVAWNFLKNLPEGTIKLVVRRRTQQPDSNQLH